MEAEYLETDVRKIVLEHLRKHGVDAELLEPGKSDMEKPPYYTNYFSGTAKMVDSAACIAVRGRNFDGVHIVRRG
jgi:hypothetical protein